MNASLPIKFAPHTGTEIVCWAEGPATMDSKLLRAVFTEYLQLVLSQVCLVGQRVVARYDT